MKKIVLPLFALVIIMSACVKTPEPIRFSILGDSYSAYEGFVYPDTNDVYHFDEIGVTGSEQMWWAQVADSTGWILERNNSFSGSMISNFDIMDFYLPVSDTTKKWDLLLKRPYSSIYLKIKIYY